jgi:uncharacterized protein YegP (UPF0339 family)
VRARTDEEPGDAWQICDSRGNGYHFELKAGTGEIIASSEMYTTKAAAKNGIESVKENAPKAETVDDTGD